ncbi:DUF2935 domain-containing protein [Brevibacillus humidisoli]|uniref:DUF2935 domain-containing protein n=1 Tax=Brevibacillus humidisoli TaxID=2895522 RepID=UPI001E64F28F|nr:DUF2935 domain-containing protein [Brevibacillus humidisoli]UFJ39314.1 DUF2935 domain-containing protein [Brevibacillus humidisoli]
MSGFDQAALFEHRFWLQIMGDHARFILQGLAPTETEEWKRAEYFKQVYDLLLEKARLELSGDELTKLTEQAQHYTIEFRSFKLHLLRRHLVGEIAISLPPTFINHMVNELEEYVRILQCLCKGEAPAPCHPVHYHLLWLPDAAGHAGSITSSLDLVEHQLKEKSREYTRSFEQLYLKAVELAGYLRTHLEQFPALSRFNHQVELEIALFTKFLHEIEEMELTDTVLGTLSPLMPDHMAREECYYLINLAHVTELTPPDCDPTRPRVEQE